MAKAKKELPVILITNDDDITSPGIHSLVDAVRGLGKIVVVAPEKPQSGMGHATTIGMPLRMNKVNFFARARVNTRKSISTSLSDRTDFLRNDTTSNFTQNSKPLSNGYFAFLRGGFDYFIDNRNTITVGGTYVTGQFKNSDLISKEGDNYGKHN